MNPLKDRPLHQISFIPEDQGLHQLQHRHLVVSPFFLADRPIAELILGRSEQYWEKPFQEHNLRHERIALSLAGRLVLRELEQILANYPERQREVVHVLEYLIKEEFNRLRDPFGVHLEPGLDFWDSQHAVVLLLVKVGSGALVQLKLREVDTSVAVGVEGELLLLFFTACVA